MMELLLNVFLFIMLLGLFNLIRYILKIRKVMKMHKDNPNIQGISIVNGEVRIIEKVPSQQMATTNPIVIDSVKDPICGKEIAKEDAYRVWKQGKEYFFCSWECREQFLSKQS